MKRLVLVFVAILFSLILGSCQEKLDWILDIDVVSGNIEPTEDDETVYYEEIMSVIAIGKRSAEPSARPRKELNEVVRFF